MIDYNAMHDSNHQGYQRWQRNIDDTKLKYLGDRASAIEKAKLRDASKGVSVKKPSSPAAPRPAGGSAASPSRPGAPSGNRSFDENRAGLLARYSKPATPNARGGPSVWSDNAKGYNQPSMQRTHVGGPSTTRTSPWSSPAPGMDLSGIHRSPRTPSTSSAPAASPASSPAKQQAAPRMTVRQAWSEGVADIQARRIEQHTRMAQAARAPKPLTTPKPSGPGWLARTGEALIARADQIGTEHAVRTRNFGGGAQSHQTGHGRRAF